MKIEIPACSAKELAQVFGLLLQEDLKPDNAAWQTRQRGRLRGALQISDRQARDLLVRALFSLDFISRNKEKLVTAKVLATDEKAMSMQVSPYLLTVLARAKASEKGLEDQAIFFALRKLSEQVAPSAK